MMRSPAGAASITGGQDSGNKPNGKLTAGTAGKRNKTYGTMEEIPKAELEQLLRLAETVIVWTGQGTLKPESAGLKHLLAARQEYRKTWIDTFAKVRPLLAGDLGGCICPCTKDGIQVLDDCMYHYGAGLQPDNHRIPWNCPTFYDGCNCEPEICPLCGGQDVHKPECREA